MFSLFSRCERALNNFSFCSGFLKKMCCAYMRYLPNVLLRSVSHFDGDGRRRVGFCRQTSDWARDAFSECDDVSLLKLVKFNRRWSLWKKWKFIRIWWNILISTLTFLPVDLQLFNSETTRTYTKIHPQINISFYQLHNGSI